MDQSPIDDVVVDSFQDERIHFQSSLPREVMIRDVKVEQDRSSPYFPNCNNRNLSLTGGGFPRTSSEVSQDAPTNVGPRPGCPKELQNGVELNGGEW